MGNYFSYGEGWDHFEVTTARTASRQKLCNSKLVQYTALENCQGVNSVMLPLLIINLDIIPKVTSGLKISRRIKRIKKRSQLDFLVLHCRYAYSK